MSQEEDHFDSRLKAFYPNLEEEDTSSKIKLLTAQGILGRESPLLEHILNGMDVEQLRALVKNRIVRLVRSRIGDKSDLILEGSRAPIFSTEINVATEHGRLHLVMDTPKSESTYRQLTDPREDTEALHLGIIHSMGYGAADRVIAFAPVGPAQTHVARILRKNALLAGSLRNRHALSTLWKTDTEATDLFSLIATCNVKALHLKLEVGTTFLFDARKFVSHQHPTQTPRFSRVYSTTLPVGKNTPPPPSPISAERPVCERRNPIRPTIRDGVTPLTDDFYGYSYKKK